MNPQNTTIYAVFAAIIVAVVVIVLVSVLFLGVNKNSNPTSVVKEYFNSMYDSYYGSSDLIFEYVYDDNYRRVVSIDLEIDDVTYLDDFSTGDRNDWEDNIDEIEDDYDVRVQDFCRVEGVTKVVYEQDGDRDTEYDDFQLYCIKVDGKWYMYNHYWW